MKSYGYSCRHLETTQSSWLSHQIERIILEWPSYDFVSSHFLLFFPKLMMEFSEQLGYYAGLRLDHTRNDSVQKRQSYSNCWKDSDPSKARTFQIRYLSEWRG